MIVGIRGTAGYVEVVDRWTTELTVLEGVVRCSVADPVTGQVKSETVQGGETVRCVVYPQDQPGDKCDILREKTAVEDIPGYVLTDVVRDMALCDRIEADTGTDILEELAKIVGGDPSGLSASPEVLGEADRRENQDETELQAKQERVDAEQKAQENKESGDKVFIRTPDQSDASDDSDSSVPTSVTRTMPQTSAEVQALLDRYETVILRSGANAGDNTLVVDSPLSVAGGKSLTLENGVGMRVQAGTSLRVDGTLTGGNTLRLSGDLSGSGQLIVTATYTFNGWRNAKMGGFPVTAIKESAFSGSGLTNIGDSAFDGCTSLTSINIPGGVTGIGNNAFSTCGSLTGITIPDSVVCIRSNAFTRSGLTKITYGGT